MADWLDNIKFQIQEYQARRKAMEDWEKNNIVAQERYSRVPISTVPAMPNGMRGVYVPTTVGNPAIAIAHPTKEIVNPSPQTSGVLTHEAWHARLDNREDEVLQEFLSQKGNEHHKENFPNAFRHFQRRTGLNPDEEAKKIPGFVDELNKKALSEFLAATGALNLEEPTANSYGFGGYAKYRDGAMDFHLVKALSDFLQSRKRRAR